MSAMDDKMSCMACEAAIQLKKIGLDAECDIVFCKTLKDEPSFSAIREKGSLSKAKRTQKRKDKLFRGVRIAYIQAKPVQVEVNEDGTVKEESGTNKEKKVEKVKVSKPVVGLGDFLPDFLQ